MPPAPSQPTISYGPIEVPIGIVIDAARGAAFGRTCKIPGDLLRRVAAWSISYFTMLPAVGVSSAMRENQISTPATRRVLVLVVSALTCGCGQSKRAGSSPTMPSGPPAAAPAVAAVSPDHGPTWRYTAVEVRGSGFQPGATVMFDGATS